MCGQPGVSLIAEVVRALGRVKLFLRPNTPINSSCTDPVSVKTNLGDSWVAKSGRGWFKMYRARDTGTM